MSSPGRSPRGWDLRGVKGESAAGAARRRRLPRWTPGPRVAPPAPPCPGATEEVSAPPPSLSFAPSRCPSERPVLPPARRPAARRGHSPGRAGRAGLPGRVPGGSGSEEPGVGARESAGSSPPPPPPGPSPRPPLPGGRGPRSARRRVRHKQTRLGRTCTSELLRPPQIEGSGRRVARPRGPPGRAGERARPGPPPAPLRSPPLHGSAAAALAALPPGAAPAPRGRALGHGLDGTAASSPARSAPAESDARETQRERKSERPRAVRPGPAAQPSPAEAAPGRAEGAAPRAGPAHLPAAGAPDPPGPSGRRRGSRSGTARPGHGRG